MPKILTLNKIAKIGLDKFDSSYEISDTAANPDGIILRSYAMHDMDIPESVLGIARAGAGVNNIPIDKCTEKGIVVFNTPGANANAVKELTITGLLLASRKITAGISWAQSLSGADVDKQVEKGKSSFAGPEISGKTLGVIGLGAIGVMVANAASALGMDVIGYDPYLSVDAAWNLSRATKKAASLNEIFEKSDYITMHLPLTPDTKNTINDEAISMMKDGVRILNFARGGLVDNEALLKAVKNGKISCYVTDFVSEDLIGVDNVITIPHLGASTPESEDNCAVMAAKQLKEYIENGNITNSVNFPRCYSERTGGRRLCIINRNKPNMLGQISTLLANEDINIEHMTNKSKGDYAYTMIDVDDISNDVIEKVKTVDGVIRLRLI